MFTFDDFFNFLTTNMPSTTAILLTCDGKVFAVSGITSYCKTVGLVGCEILVDGPGSSDSVRAVSCKAIGFLC